MISFLLLSVTDLLVLIIVAVHVVAGPIPISTRIKFGNLPNLCCDCSKNRIPNPTSTTSLPPTFSTTSVSIGPCINRYCCCCDDRSGCGSAINESGSLTSGKGTIGHDGYVNLPMVGSNRPCQPLHPQPQTLQPQNPCTMPIPGISLSQSGNDQKPCQLSSLSRSYSEPCSSPKPCSILGFNSVPLPMSAYNPGSQTQGSWSQLKQSSRLQSIYTLKPWPISIQNPVQTQYSTWNSFSPGSPVARITSTYVSPLILKPTPITTPCKSSAVIQSAGISIVASIVFSVIATRSLKI